MVWEHVKQALKYFIVKFNTFHPTVKLISEWSKNNVTFLDICVTRMELSWHAPIFTFHVVSSFLNARSLPLTVKLSYLDASLRTEESLMSCLYRWKIGTVKG